ncbi:MAG: alanine--tRNA ligase [Oscillospiraceae bacterium]|nr:alanine--tRNA ligase [Oscillospiraceae bacterium]
MKWTGLNDLRESYLRFFESKGHLRMDSAPLVPKDDNSILLINAGMTPLKKYFQGIEEPPCHRVTTCQKCIRTPDIENVGKTARHGTYFEMLGNFSFGDYFKHEATAWAWEYLTKVLEIPAERLWITIYEEDDEAGDIWANEVGIPRERIVKLGKADNFWEHGSGPCGPCSEIHFDRGEKYGPFESFEQAGDCDRLIEIWNLVFTQFDNDGHGNYSQLATKNIDTGMGLERLACVMQDVDNLFEVDTVQNIMKKISELTGKVYKQNDKDDVSIRVITDHIRSTTFMVGDGILPSNEGRGYVLRRLLRRAARHGRILGTKKPFLYEVVDTVINENVCAYPDLESKREYIKRVIKQEEEAFAKTVENGSQILDQYIADIKAKGGDMVLGGEEAFKLHDTYGFPLDLTKEICAENGITVDEDKFHECMTVQKKTARENRKLNGGWDDASASVLTQFTTKFVGYTDLEYTTKLLAMVKDGDAADICEEGDRVTVLLETTPFYAESGGQVGDKGTIESNGNVMEVLDTQKLTGGQFVCHCEVTSGGFTTGETVTAKVNKELRDATARNHTAAHLLQAALRNILGEHVHQAGQLVSPERMRFDFAHFSAVTPEELQQIENSVNNAILSAIELDIKEMPIEEAQKLGAMALFGEKYGKVVRVVNVPGVSLEFCGGTHVKNTSNIGLFKIISENSVAAGVRRIEAVTGTGVLSLIDEYKGTIDKAAAAIKAPNASELAAKCAAASTEIKDLEKQIAELNSKLASGQLDAVLDNAKTYKNVRISSVKLSGVKPDVLRTMGDQIKDKAPDIIAVLVSDSSMLCVSGKEAVAAGAHSGKIVQKIAAITGGKGGGRPDNAMAGIGDVSKVDEALAALENVVAEFVK